VVSDDRGVTILLARAAGQPRCTIRRGAGNDIVRGTPGRDVICTGSGNDIVYGLGGNDLIRGGHGNDIVRGGDGHDRVEGGAGNDNHGRDGERPRGRRLGQRHPERPGRHRLA